MSTWVRPRAPPIARHGQGHLARAPGGRRAGATSGCEPRLRRAGAGGWGAPTFFFSSTLMALASLRKMALPQSRSRRDVNWYHFHFRKAHSASSHSRSVHWTVGRGHAVTRQDPRSPGPGWGPCAWTPAFTRTPEREPGGRVTEAAGRGRLRAPRGPVRERPVSQADAQ